MKLSEALNYKGKPYEIPDCGRDNLPWFLKDHGYQTGAEIGVFKGEFTEKFCRAGLTMYAIDPWMAYKGAGRTEQHQEKQDAQFEETVERLSSYDCTILRKTSMEALAYIKDSELDFVYIDGDHSFRHIAADLVEWSQKVRKGGIIAGHDYFNTAPHASNVICHVKAVVDAYADVYDLNFWIFGKTGETKNDQYHSWMFVK